VDRIEVEGWWEGFNKLRMTGEMFLHWVCRSIL